ncbi:MAG: hypothetical protein IKZ21_08020 [Clostridia bacterium]|nr:hypothetical protein [Clostridia bacterium]
MKQFESKHYRFHYGTDTLAEADIVEIAARQEACFRHICRVLHVTPNFKIQYFLCDSPEEVGRIYGDNEACNGFAAPPDTVYAVYNEKVQCIGFHEDAHLISYTLNRPDCPAIREGLAMYFDRKWWGIQNLDWAGYFLKTGRYLPVDKLLDKAYFFSQNDSITYPIMGAFTDWLIATYGIDAFLRLYREQNIASAMTEIYHVSPEDLNRAFVDYLRLFKTDTSLEQRMKELLEK